MPQSFRIKTAAFKASDLLLESFSCSEALSSLTEITVSLLSPRMRTASVRSTTPRSAAGTV